MPHSCYTFSIILLLCSFFLNTAGLRADESEKPGALIATDRITRTLVVDPRVADADDRNPGTPEKPFRTIQAALNRAKALLLMGEGVRVHLAPVTFRESLHIEFKEEVDAELPPLAIEAIELGETTITGADRLDEGWDADEGYYVRDWPYTFEDMDIQAVELAKRRELLFISGVRLTQVGRKGAVRMGKFHVDREDGRVWMIPPRGAVASRDAIEVGVPERAQLLRAVNVPNLLVQGVVFEKAASGVGGNAAVHVVGGENIYFNGCGFDYHGGSAVFIDGARYATVFGCYLNRNGWRALRVRNVTAVEIGGLVAEFNGWRAFEAGIKSGWSAVDISLPTSRNETPADEAGRLTIYRSRIENGHIGGYRLRAAEINARRLFAGGNAGDGIILEEGQGNLEDALIKRAEVVRNGGNGLTLNGRATIQYGLFYGNGTKEQRLAAEIVLGPTAQVYLKQNVIVSDSEGVYCLALPQAKDDQLDAYKGERNLFYAPDKQAFRVGDVALGLGRWRALTGEDLTSRMTEPGFADAPALDFTLSPASPILERAEWKPIEPDTTRDKARQWLREQSSSSEQ